jgi:hypothetical protein
MTGGLGVTLALIGRAMLWCMGGDFTAPVCRPF